MPIYEYRCQDCQHVFEALRSINDSDTPIICSKCNSPTTIRIQSACSSRVNGSSPSSGGTGCGNCNGGNCSSCSH